MQKLRSGFGYIGYFDILGYQSFLENNEAELALSEVVGIITNIDKHVTTTILENLGHTSKAPESKDPQAEFRRNLEEIKWLIFSDTVLMLMEDEGPDLFPQMFRAISFSLAVGVLFRNMFDLGLPLRGAIGRGKFVYSNNSFAGRTIVDAYRLANSLNLSACAVHDAFLDAEKNKMHPSVAEFWNIYLVPYLTPLHDGHRRITLLNHLFFPEPDDPLSKSGRGYGKRNLRQEVLDRFWAHGKDIGPDADIKASNTEKFIRYLFHAVTAVAEKQRRG